MRIQSVLSMSISCPEASDSSRAETGRLESFVIEPCMIADGAGIHASFVKEVRKRISRDPHE